MEFFETVSSRQSTRAYHPTAVKNINLDKILTAANTAPSDLSDLVHEETFKAA